MRIGELADLVGLNAKTIRYYESIGLLPAPERQASGYRDYSEEDVERLRFVRTAQRLNLSLSEIAEILRFRERDERPCEYVLGVLDRQVADLDGKMAEMAELRRELISLKAKADELPRDEGCYCAVIEHSQRAEGGPVAAGLRARRVTRRSPPSPPHPASPERVRSGGVGDNVDRMALLGRTAPRAPIPVVPASQTRAGVRE